MEEGGGVDAELSVNRKVLWDKGADKIQLNKPNSPDLWSFGLPACLTAFNILKTLFESSKTLVHFRFGGFHLQGCSTEMFKSFSVFSSPSFILFV